MDFTALQKLLDVFGVQIGVLTTVVILSYTATLWTQKKFPGMSATAVQIANGVWCLVLAFGILKTDWLPAVTTAAIAFFGGEFIHALLTRKKTEGIVAGIRNGGSIKKPFVYKGSTGGPGTNANDHSSR